MLLTRTEKVSNSRSMQHRSAFGDKKFEEELKRTQYVQFASLVAPIKSCLIKSNNIFQYLWLNDNPFKTLNPLLFDHKTIPSISEIYLWGNNWKCDCKLKWLKEMQEAR